MLLKRGLGWKIVLVFGLSLILCSYNESAIRPQVIRLFNAVKGKGFKVISTTTKLDARGVPITVYPELGPQYNPVHIALQGLAYLDAGEYELFLNIADWFVENGSFREDYVVWEYEFPWEVYNMTPPWISGMAQGLAVRILGHAYRLTGEEMYREVANQALKSFLVPVEQGGVRLDTEDGWWYEEYADPGGRNPRVLNGMIFALEGIYDFWLITGDDMARVIFEKGILALRAELPRYDAWGWSYYDALGNIASDKYHRFHVRQMKWLFLVTGDPIYARYAEDWEDDLVSPFRFVSLILIRGPQESDLVLLFCNMTAIFLTIQAGHWAILKIKARLPEVRRRDTSRTIDSC